MIIDISEVYRYLSVIPDKADDKTKALIDECVKEIKRESRSKHFYKVFDIKEEKYGISLLGSTLLLPGNDIKKHLEGCKKCAVMAVTLGIEIDRLLDFYSRLDLAKGLVINACATAAVEAVCDEIQEEIEMSAQYMSCGITERYSPGYGDLPLTLQSDIVNALNLYKSIGLSVNDSSILIPRKSVTAIVGIGSGKRNDVKSNKCKSCIMETACEFRKRGINCE